jgi:hypothetical protein
MFGKVTLKLEERSATVARLHLADRAEVMNYAKFPGTARAWRRRSPLELGGHHAHMNRVHPIDAEYTVNRA